MSKTSYWILQHFRACMVILAGLMIYAGGSHSSLYAADTQPKILILGDSLSAAYGLEQHQGWVSLLRQRLIDQGYTYTVINAAISGETTQGGLTRLPQLLKEHQPKVVFIELGGNDGLRGQPIPNTKKNLAQMIELAQASGAQVVLGGIMIPPNYGPRYPQMFSQMYPDLGEEHNVAVIPFILQGIADQPNLMQADQIHPKAQAQPMLLDNIWPVLMPLLNKDLSKFFTAPLIHSA